MSRLEFIASIVSSITWPLVLLAVLALFRAQLVAILGRIKAIRTTAKGMSIDVTLEDEAISLNARTKAAFPQAPSEPIKIELQTIVDIDPRQAIMLGWRTVSDQVAKTATALGLDDTGGGLAGNVRVMQQLVDDKRLRADIAPIGQGLFDLYRDAHNDAEISHTAARVYISAVERVVAELRTVAQS